MKTFASQFAKKAGLVGDALGTVPGLGFLQPSNETHPFIGALQQVAEQQMKSDAIKDVQNIGLAGLGIGGGAAGAAALARMLKKRKERRLNPVLPLPYPVAPEQAPGKLSKSAMSDDAKRELLTATGVTLGGAGLGGIFGAIDAPKGHKLEGAYRAATAGAPVGLSGYALASGMKDLAVPKPGSSPMAGAAKATAGLVGADALMWGGKSLPRMLYGRPSWEVRPDNIHDVLRKKQKEKKAMSRWRTLEGLQSLARRGVQSGESSLNFLGKSLQAKLPGTADFGTKPFNRPSGLASAKRIMNLDAVNSDALRQREFYRANKGKYHHNGWIDPTINARPENSFGAGQEIIHGSHMLPKYLKDRNRMLNQRAQQLIENAPNRSRIHPADLFASRDMSREIQDIQRSGGTPSAQMLSDRAGIVDALKQSWKGPAPGPKPTLPRYNPGEDLRAPLAKQAGISTKAGLPWYGPAMLFGGMAGLGLGWKGIDSVLRDRAKEDREEELDNARTEFHDALLSQYSHPLKSAPKVAQDSELSRELDRLFDLAQSATEKQAMNMSDYGGMALGGYGMYSGLTGLLAGSIVYDQLKKRSRKAILDKALQKRERRRFAQSPPEIYAMPEPMNQGDKAMFSKADARALKSAPSDEALGV